MTDETPTSEVEPEFDPSDYAEAETVPWLCQLQLADGDIFLNDIQQFEALTKALATKNWDGQLYVLTAEHPEWVSVEALLNKKPKNGGQLRSIKAAVKT